jgi:hypothetical protein
MEITYPKRYEFTNGLFMVFKNETEEIEIRKKYPQWFYGNKTIKTETVAAPVVIQQPIITPVIATTVEPVTIISQPKPNLIDEKNIPEIPYPMPEKKKPGRPKGS